MPPSRILGIDPGLATVGYGLIRIEGTTPYADDFGVISTPAKTEISARLETIYDDLHFLLSKMKPELVVIEKFFGISLANNTILVAQARGVIALVIGQHKIPVLEFNPRQIKQQLTGNGNAQKIEVQEAVTQELRLDKIPRPDDAADALAIALTGYYRYGEVIS